MKKKYKGTLIVTIVVILLPVLVGLICWNQLPDKMATHFGSNNEPNGWSSKEFTVFGLPCMMVLLQIFCFFVTINDPKKRNISEKFFTVILWVVPVASLIVSLATYGYALGVSIDIGMIVNIMVGVLFIVLGNYLHKVKQNYTVGIKIPWTLNSEENWNRTHRLASWIFIVCGIGFILNSVIRMDGIFWIIMIACLMIPWIYSFVLYKKGI